jgi:predicted transcriptional regulator
MRTISLKLPESLDRKLTSIAHRRRTTRSAVVRQALERFAGAPGRSVTALAEDLAGSLRGDTDLSTSPRHMAAYGK